MDKPEMIINFDNRDEAIQEARSISEEGQRVSVWVRGGQYFIYNGRPQQVPGMTFVGLADKGRMDYPQAAF